MTLNEADGTPRNKNGLLRFLDHLNAERQGCRQVWIPVSICGATQLLCRADCNKMMIATRGRAFLWPKVDGQKRHTDPYA